MIPLTENPTINILLDPDTGNVNGFSTNIAADVKVIPTYDPAEFKENTRGMPFTNEVCP